MLYIDVNDNNNNNNNNNNDNNNNFMRKDSTGKSVALPSLSEG